MTCRRTAVAGASVSLALLAGGCAPATPDTNTYAHEVRHLAGTALAQVTSTQLLLRALADGDVFWAYAVTTVRGNEQSTSAAVDSFTAFQPPPRAKQLQRQASSLLSRAADLVTAARVAVLREDTARYQSIGRRLESVAGGLRKVESP